MKYFWRKLEEIINYNPATVWAPGNPQCKLKWSKLISVQSSPASRTKWQWELLSGLGNFLISLADSCGGWFAGGGGVYYSTDYSVGDKYCGAIQACFIRHRPAASLLYIGDIYQYCVEMPNFLEIKLAIFYIQFYKFCFLQFWFPEMGVLLETVRGDIVLWCIVLSSGGASAESYYQCHR